MNMFKRGRKAKDDAFPTSPDTSLPPPAFKSSKTLKRKNKNVEEEKPAFDLSSALPDTNEFRTSLLMPGLSARFSMLREQDDPNTKVGKASDDSVLFPKRASRMNLFSHNPHALADISEVESIRSSFKPPFADRERANSFNDGYDSDSGSIMTRARPGEGNNLFGGRQKLYRIPTSSTKTLTDPDTGSLGGRYMYESDVSLSLFQQYRAKEREARRSDEENRDPHSLDAYDSDAVTSLTAGSSFSTNRDTQSSTTSARSNTRTSTAATSITSDSPVAQTAGSHNLKYPRKSNGDGLNKVGEPVSSIAGSLRRLQDDRPTPQLSHSKSLANVRDRSQRSGVLYPAGTFRGINPPFSAGPTQPLDFGFGDRANSPASSRHDTHSPTPSAHDSGDVLANSVQPNDRGKATAMGLFNKPAKEFDEKQYLQRQLQMHEGRNSPNQTSSRSTSREEVRRGWHQGTNFSRMTPSPAPSELTSASQAPAIPETSIPNSHRTSRASNASSDRQTQASRPRSKSSASITAKDNVKARVESLIRKQNAELAALEDEKLGVEKAQSEAAQRKDGDSTFFDNDDSSSGDDQSFSDARQSKASSTRLADGDVHPAFRTSLAPSTHSRQSNFDRVRSTTEELPNDPQMLSLHTGTSSGIGLSGLIRTHLRHDSDKSSIYPPPSPRHSYSLAADGLSGEVSDLDTARSARDQKSIESTAPSTVNFQSRRRASDGKADEVSPSSSPQERRWQDGLEPSHKRGESTATTKERREFDAELAERRRRIREGLKSVAERDRSQSPIAMSPPGREHTMQAFIQSKGDLQPKAVKTLGIDLNSPFPPKFQIDQRGFDTARGREMYMKHTASRNVGESRSREDTHSSTRENDGFSRSHSTSQRRVRSRSNSAAAERHAGSRQGYREDQNPPLPSSLLASKPQSPSYESTFALRDRSGSGDDNRRYMVSPTYDLNSAISPSSIRSPTSAMPPYMDHPRSMSQSSSGRATPQQANGRTTPVSNGKSSPFGNRKRSGTKTQISGPTFISSTASVPLVPLPQGQDDSEAPPLPEMNPRRRGTFGERPHPTLNLGRSTTSPLEVVPGSPGFPSDDVQRHISETGQVPVPPRRLHKSSSEGGSMAARARHQALAAEINREKSRTPVLPVFPNKSATTLGTSHEGGMI